MRTCLIFALGAALPLLADDVSSPLPAPLHMGAAAVPAGASSATATSTAAVPTGPVNEATVEHQGYPAERYQSLWTQSPFAVETPDENVAESAEYLLYGVSNIGGVTYASLVEKQNQNHHLISSDKITDGLQLTSVTRKEGGDTYATFVHNGLPITLKLEAAPAGGTTGPGGAVFPQAQFAMPGVVPQNIPMPGTNLPGRSPRPPTRFHRPLIHMPPRPPTEAAPVATPAPVNAPAPPPANP